MTTLIGAVVTAPQQLAALLFGSAEVDQALSRAASVARFGDDDLISILAHAGQSQEMLVWADEGFSAQLGTEAWASFGR